MSAGAEQKRDQSREPPPRDFARSSQELARAAANLSGLQWSLFRLEFRQAQRQLLLLAGLFIFSLFVAASCFPLLLLTIAMAAFEAGLPLSLSLFLTVIAALLCTGLAIGWAYRVVQRVKVCFARSQRQWERNRIWLTNVMNSHSSDSSTS